MKMYLFKKLSIWPILLLGIVALLSVLNYTPNTWLTGWDTLHPEFDFGLNFQRVISGVWRAEQGVGAVAGHSHMSEFPRLILLFLSSLVLPVSFLRYFYFFVCLLLGPLGVYFFLKKWVLKNNLNSETGSFLGGLFYLLNLGTLQHFYAPFEMFASLYAFLPWLMLLTAKFLNEGRRKDIVLFSLVTFLAVPMAYASALWFVYFAFFCIFLFFSWIFERKLVNFKRAAILFLLTIFVNSFWLFPNIYFLKTTAKNVSSANINLMFSNKAFSYDLKYATLDNAFLLKGFLFDWQQYEKGEFSNLMAGWQNHLKSTPILVIGYFLFALVLSGVIFSFFKKEKKILVLIPGLIFAFIFLIHGVFGIETIFIFLREKLDIFKEALRFPWTKFSIPVIFSFSVFFGFGLSQLLNIFNKKFRSITIVIISTLLIVWMWPAFKGDFVSSHFRIKIPDEYFQTFSYFKDQPASERIAVLPLSTNMGWEYYRWGFEGAGFVWFGLKQPVLVRDFDRWNPANENFYWEASRAIYSKDEVLLEKVLEKYQVSWLILDENIISPAWPKAIFSEEVKDMLQTNGKIVLTKSFKNISIYKVNLDVPTTNFTFTQNLTEISSSYKWTNFDKAFSDLGNYFTSTEKTKNSVYYPFRSVFTGREAIGNVSKENDFTIEDLGDRYLIRKELPEEILGHELAVQNYSSDELIFVDSIDLNLTNYFVPQAIINGNTLEVSFPKIGGYFSGLTYPAFIPNILEAKNCNTFSKGMVSNELVNYDDRKSFRLKSTDATNCSAAISFPGLQQDLSYLITVEHKNISGKPLLFWLENMTLRRSDMELYLDKGQTTSYLIQPPMKTDGLGYTLHFDNISIGDDQTINDLKKVAINLFPYRFLSSLVFVPKEINSQKVLVYSQAYDEGWHAYQTNLQFTIYNLQLKKLLAPLFGKELKDHVLVNNWENGWVLPSTDDGLQTTADKTIVFVFLPQYLEYLGFGLLGMTIILLGCYLVIAKKR